MAREDRLRIVTLNLWNLNHWSERQEEVSSWITYLRPDVVGLQEVTRTATEDPAAWLGEQSGMEVAYGSFPRADGSDFGNATLSRFPISDVAQRSLPMMDHPSERRLCLRTTLDTQRGPIDVYNTHLNYLFDEGYIREAQVLALSEFVSESRLTACPPILIGDFNAQPASTEIRYVKGLASLQGRSFHMFDSFEAMNPQATGFTWDNRNPWAATNRVPDQRIDYIFVGVRGEDGTGQITASRTVFDHMIGTSFASDHFGLLTEIVFNQPATDLTAT